MHNHKSYRTDPKTVALALFILVGPLVLTLLNENEGANEPLADVFIGAFALAMFIALSSERYIIQDGLLVRKEFYVYRKAIPIKQSQSVKKGGSFKILPTIYPALHLTYINDRGVDGYFLLRYIKFSERTLAGLVRDLPHHNPRIEIDDDVRRLIASLE